MQTYLPDPDFYVSAKLLDKKRLNNQRNENFVIADCLLGLLPPNHPWMKHPAVRMWQGHEIAFSRYMQDIHYTCSKRGIKSAPETILRVVKTMVRLAEHNPEDDGSDPDWIGGFVHENHRAKLLFKDPEYYQQHNWKEKPDGRSWYAVPWGRKQQDGYGDHKRLDSDLSRKEK